MNPSSTGAAPGTMTLNDYRIRGFVPEDTSSGPSTTALVMASALVVAVLAVDAYVFFGPSRSDGGSAAPTTPVTAPRADIAPTPVAPSTPATLPAMSSPVGTQPSLARVETRSGVETRSEPTAETPAPARPSAPAKAAATKSPAPMASVKTTTPRKAARAESAASPATPSQTPAATSPAVDPPSTAPSSSPSPAPAVTPPAPSASAPAPIVVPAEPVAAAPQQPATSSN